MRQFKYLKQFEYYTNPYNPTEIWDSFRLIDIIEDEDINDKLDNLIGKKIKFKVKRSNEHVWGLHCKTEVEGVLQEYEISQQEEMGIDTFTNVYFKVDNNFYNVCKYDKIDIQ